MELLCIQSHSQRLVEAGNTYRKKSDKCPCKCKAYDVGVKSEFLAIKVKCRACGAVYQDDGIAWIHQSLFAPIATDNELKEEKYEQDKFSRLGSLH